MAATAVSVWAGFATGGKMPAVRGRMRNNGGAGAGQSKVSGIDQPEPDGQDGK